MLLFVYSGHWEYLTTIGYFLWTFGNFEVVWYIFPCFGILYQEKSGNTAQTLRPRRLKQMPLENTMTAH
jgi:hypothetical protein